MKTRLPALLVCLAIDCLLVCRPGHAAASGAARAEAEAAVRKADSDWEAAAKTGSVEAWLAFYAADAIVLPPNAPLASGAERIRQTVTSLLALPHSSISWHPIKTEVAASGDLAYVIGTYEFKFDDSHDVPVWDQGKLLEIWRQRADGSWKCIVHTWSSNGPSTQTAQPAPASGANLAPAAAEMPMHPGSAELPAPSAAPPGPISGYGEIPAHYEESIRQYFQTYLKDPESVVYKEISRPEKGYATTVTGALFTHETRLLGWTVNATVNAKNSRGRYVGFKTYTFLFRGEKIVHTASPIAEDEMK